MTTVSFLVEQARIVGFDVQGHSGWGQEGEAESTCQNLLTGLMVYLTQLHDEYPENIEVMEE